MVTLEEINMGKRKDLRVKRSKGHIVEAILRLIKDFDYDKITIRDITKEALVSRSTFYRIYQNKDDILLKHLDELFEEYFSTVSLLLKREKDHHVVSRVLLQGWMDRRDFFLAIQKANLSLKLLERFIDFSFLMLEESKQNDHNDGSRFHKYIANYSAGGIFMLLYSWLQGGLDSSIHDLGEVLGNYLKFEFEMTKYYNSKK